MILYIIMGKTAQQILHRTTIAPTSYVIHQTAVKCYRIYRAIFDLKKIFFFLTVSGSFLFKLFFFLFFVLLNWFFSKYWFSFKKKFHRVNRQSIFFFFFPVNAPLWRSFENLRINLASTVYHYNIFCLLVQINSYSINFFYLKLILKTFCKQFLETRLDR